MSDLRRTLARSHNHRVGILLVPFLVYIFGTIALVQSRGVRDVVLLVGCVFAVAGLFYVINLSKRQSVALGFVCPLCSGPLYDGGDNRLIRRGECPCCKQFIIDKL